MEKLVITSGKDELINGSLEIINQIQNKVKSNSNMLLLNNNVIDNDLTTQIYHAGIKDRKRIKKYINGANAKQTLRSYNKFLWILSKISKTVSIKIVDVKHEAIQAKKKEWIKIQKLADTAYREYKEEKGNYYK